jgi:hypothetical protein
MKCSAGVAVTAVLVLLGSALTMLGSIGMVFVYHSINFASAPPTQQLPPGFTPDTMRYFGYGLCALFLALGSLGAATGIGLLQLWRWARYSIITFGAVLALVGLMSALVMLLITLPGPDASLLLGMRIGFALFYGLWVALGIFFIVFFTRKKIVDQFKGGANVISAPPLRPVSITVIAWFMITSATVFPTCLVTHYPALLFGFVLTGVAATVLSYGILYLVLGIGLLRYKIAALWGTVGILALGVLNGLILMLPGPKARYFELMRSFSPAGQNPFLESVAFYPFMMGVGIVSVGIPLYFLLTRRNRFEAASLVNSSSPQLPSPPATPA